MMRILVVDDDSLTRRILVRMLSPAYQVTAFADGEEAFRHFAAHGAEILLTDLKMPKMNGFELLDKVHQLAPEAIVFVITGFSSIDNAVAAIKRGAYDYIAKPFEPEDVLIRIARAVKERELEGKVRVLQQERELLREEGVPLSREPAMLKVLEMAQKVARTDSTVLITGETGTGKEVLARLIHQWSPRREHAFVPVNCGALPEGVVESELFGHEKGAFTGAVARRVGYFELAHQGTLLLDEIGATDHGFQVKLLRILQDRIIYRVGSTSAMPVDVRVIAATNQDLEAEARTEKFRSDLFYRLSVVSIRVPPLRERMQDLPLLVDHFLRKYRHINPRVERISPAGMSVLASYHYPGNVRELENIIERALILEGGRELAADSLLVGKSGEKRNDGETGRTSLAMEEAEREHILRVLQQCNGRKLEAARLLGINKTTLWRKMKRYGMDP